MLDVLEHKVLSLYFHYAFQVAKLHKDLYSTKCRVPLWNSRYLFLQLHSTHAETTTVGTPTIVCTIHVTHSMLSVPATTSATFLSKFREVNWLTNNLFAIYVYKKPLSSFCFLTHPNDPIADSKRGEAIDDYIAFIPSTSCVIDIAIFIIA